MDGVQFSPAFHEGTSFLLPLLLCELELDASRVCKPVDHDSDSYSAGSSLWSRSLVRMCSGSISEGCRYLSNYMNSIRQCHRHHIFSFTYPIQLSACKLIELIYIHR